ncbi:SDR family NAD(P)-dependent oxidoreductase, partial [Cribrihabitans sp. XS_ASV171]
MARTILITGCSSGIGLDAAQGLRARGWHVFASCRQQVDCDRLRAQGFDSPRIDYADAASIGTGLTEVLEKTGG